MSEDLDETKEVTEEVEPKAELKVSPEVTKEAELKVINKTETDLINER